MTQQEKQQIAVMRSEGLSYKTIALQLNVPLNSVKTFCRRSHLGGSRAIRNLSEKSGHIGLIDAENRGNSTDDAEPGAPESVSPSAPARARVRHIFSDAPDEGAIPDVLGMLLRAHCRKR